MASIVFVQIGERWPFVWNRFRWLLRFLQVLVDDQQCHYYVPYCENNHVKCGLMVLPLSSIVMVAVKLLAMMLQMSLHYCESSHQVIMKKMAMGR